MSDETGGIKFVEYCEEKNEEISYKVAHIFLPSGYPHSVSSDYLEYQVWDTCQAFCSTVSGTLAVQAVLEGVGVGSNVASPASAAVTWILKDGIGMLGRIMFVWLKGSQFDADCKKWRLFADVLNDLALLLELYIPYKMAYATEILCLSTTMKALVGTAGGATRAALTQHQAVKGNAADVSAKDGSQESIVNLCASCVGIVVISCVTNDLCKWTCMYTLVCLHIYFNYKAVRCLNIPILNNERYRLLLQSYLPTGKLLQTKTVNHEESVCLLQGLSDTQLCGYEIHMGSCLYMPITQQDIQGKDLIFLKCLFREKKYMLIPCFKLNSIYVSFKQGYSEQDVLKAYFHAVLLAILLECGSSKPELPMVLKKRDNSPISKIISVFKSGVDDEDLLNHGNLPIAALMKTKAMIDAEFALLSAQLAKQGWDTGRHLLQVGKWVLN